MLNLTVFGDKAKGFHCAKCGEHDAYTFAMLINDSSTVALACSHCNYIEFYDYTVLDIKFSA